MCYPDFVCLGVHLAVSMLYFWSNKLLFFIFLWHRCVIPSTAAYLLLSKNFPYWNFTWYTCAGQYIFTIHLRSTAGMFSFYFCTPHLLTEHLFCKFLEIQQGIVMSILPRFFGENLHAFCIFRTESWVIITTLHFHEHPKCADPKHWSGLPASSSSSLYVISPCYSTCYKLAPLQQLVANHSHATFSTTADPGCHSGGGAKIWSGIVGVENFLKFSFKMVRFGSLVFSFFLSLFSSFLFSSSPSFFQSEWGGDRPPWIRPCFSMAFWQGRE